MLRKRLPKMPYVRQVKIHSMDCLRNTRIQPTQNNPLPISDTIRPKLSERAVYASRVEELCEVILGLRQGTIRKEFRVGFMNMPYVRRVGVAMRTLLSARKSPLSQVCRARKIQCLLSRTFTQFNFDFILAIKAKKSRTTQN